MKQPQTHYICSELVDVQGVMFCKTWVAYDATTWLDKLAITKQEMVIIGGSIISVFAIILAFTLVAKAVKEL